MRMNGRVALCVGILTAAVVSACSDSPTTPSARASMVPKVSLDVGDATNNTPVLAQLKICTLGNAGGTFTITAPQAGQGGTGTPTIKSPLTVDVNTCRIAALDNGNA